MESKNKNGVTNPLVPIQVTKEGRRLLKLVSAKRNQTMWATFAQIVKDVAKEEGFK